MLSGIYRVSVRLLNHLRRKDMLTDLCQQRHTDETVLLKCAESGLHPRALEKPGICKIPRTRDQYLHRPSMTAKRNLHAITFLEVRDLRADLDDYARAIAAWREWIARDQAE